ncbi:MAG TPA: NTP transferase domain-containing protein [Phenylobacterium sp.]
MTELRLAAVVLAGGEGRRMGGGKPLRLWRSETLIARAVAKARSYAECVAVAVREPGQVTGVAALLLLDDPSIPGPLAGLASALAFAAAEGAGAVLTLPVDAPLAPDDLARRLLAARIGDRQVVMAQSCGRWHPTFALWPSGLGPDLNAYARSGRSSLNGFARSVGVAIVDWGACEPDPFANANTSEDLARLERGAGRRRRGADQARD